MSDSDIDQILDRFDQTDPALRRRIIAEIVWRAVQLEELVNHCWIYSGYENCGYRKMTTKQKTLYDSIINKEKD